MKRQILFHTGKIDISLKMTYVYIIQFLDGTNILYYFFDKAGIISSLITPMISDTKVNASHITPATENTQ